MALTTYERSNEVTFKIGQILSSAGYINGASAPFMGQIIEAIRSSLIAEFNLLYEIPNNVDIGRASGEYLDRWGRFLDESRTTPGYVTDLTLDNVSIFLDPAITAGEITTDASGISIPKGTIISSENEEFAVETIDDIYIAADRNNAYCRVISVNPGDTFIPVGVLTVPSITLGEIENILPSALASYKLMANNNNDIAGGSNIADDETYRYILEQKAGSIGLFNEGTVNTILDIDDIIKVNIYEYLGGVNVYIETKDIELNDELVQAGRMSLRNNSPLGTPVNVYAPLFRRFLASVQLELKNRDSFNETAATVKTIIADYVSELFMGDTLEIQPILDFVKESVENVVGIRLISGTVGGRTLISNIVGVEFNEKVIMAEEDVTIL